MRLIDADELIPLIKMGECNMYDEYCQGRNGGIDFAVERIKQMPTIEELKRGKWEVWNILDHAQRPSGRKVLRCPFCGYMTDAFMSREDYCHKMTHYCPNCGSYNGGENDADDRC